MVPGQAYEVFRVHTAAGRLKHLVYPMGYTVEYARGVDGKVVSAKRTFPNRATHTFLKDMTFKPFGGPAGFANGARGEVVNQSSDCGCLEVANPGSRFEKVFTYDDNGNITGISWTNIPSYNQTYAYDEVNRLTTAATYRGAFQYTYDKVGNRLTASQEGTPESYTYVPATNRLSTVSAPDPVSLTQDAAGNTTGIGAASLIYNQRQRMIRVEEGEETLGEYTYNALGQRVTKTVDGVTTVFHYDFDGNLIAESDTEGVVAREYLYAIGTRMAMVDTPADALYYYHNDHLGTPLAMTDASGMIVWEAAYTPFGDARVSVRATIENPFRFPGQYFDAETGLHYNYHRYYDPQTGRYLRPDPIGLEGGINLYAYVENHPVNFFDPHGLVHMGFVNILKNMADKSIRKTIKSLEKKIAKHEEVLNDPAQKLAKKHHEHELKVFKEQHELAIKEASKRGLLGVLPFIGTLLDPFGAEAFGNLEQDADGNGIPDYLEQYNEDPCR